MKELITYREIVSRIYLFRGKKVMLDRDLALLYEVPTKVLNQAVKRNLSRFPADFMFQIDSKEFEILKSQFVTSSWGGVRKRPYVFTEQGVAMLSGILKSEKAIQVNISIMRAFVKMRELIEENAELKKKLYKLEKQYDKQFKIVFEAIRSILSIESKPKNPLGFKIPE